MEKRIVFKNQDGSIGIIAPAALPKMEGDRVVYLGTDITREVKRNKNPDKIVALCLDILAKKDVPEGCAYRIVDAAAIPRDRLFRNAWRDTAGVIAPDISCARSIAHDMRRVKRSEAFAPLDDAIAKALPGTDMEAMEAGRQEIRDADDSVQTAIDGARDEKTLRAVLTGAGLTDHPGAP